MKRILFATVIFAVLFSTYSAQDKTEGTFGISFKGFVKTDMMFDSRQAVTAREGHFLLYPAAENLDANGDDINDKANLNMLSVQTRLTGTITGPNVLGAKTSGVIEGAFFGHSDGDINGFRLRHAFVKLDWENTSLTVGQTWHPMFITEVFPGVVSFNTGVPFQPFSRNPQIRFVQKFDKVQLALVAASQRDFASTGPAGTSSSYLRNSVIPILNANLKYVDPNVVIGAGVNFQSLTPRIVTTANYKTDETVTGLSFIGFAKYSANDFTIKLEGVMGQNTTDLMMLGGYAVKSANPVTGVEEYTPLKVMSAWTELVYGKDVELGIFAGYTKNLGSDDNISGVYYSRGSNIASVMRVSPRVIFTFGNTKFAGELEYTSADYGTTNSKGEVENTTSVSNVRVLLSAMLFF